MNDLDPLYQEFILDLYRNPHNQGEITDAHAIAADFNPSCGDRIKLSLKFDGETLTEVKHLTQGCAVSQASVSLLTDFIKGKTKSELKNLSVDEAIALLGIPISHTRQKCASLGWMALQKTLWITG